MHKDILIKRFKKKFIQGGEDECWKWCGQIRAGSGVGLFKMRQQLYYAHRLAYELKKGPIPPGKFVLHSCENKRCVNPKHLYLATPMELQAIIREKNKEDTTC